MTAETHFIIATAGHVDHGKSALVKALTGVDPDRLPEEKARHITIDLGFAELNLSGPNDQQIHAAIIDVPGHEDFVRNMIAGVGSIDLALLVVAADDGWMPQTEEHLQILEYLGVDRAIVALTKSDIGNPDAVERQIQNQLGGTVLADAPIIRTSLHHKPPTVETGLSELRRAIADELLSASPQRDLGKPRLFVDRAFTLHGIGTVVTGTLTGGTFRGGDIALVQPRVREARIRSLQTHGRQIEVALPGMRVAMNLADVEIDKDIVRGDVLTVPGFTATDVLGVAVMKSVRSTERPVKNRARVYLHLGTRRIGATIRLLGTDTLQPGNQAIARLHLETRTVAFLGDRFVLRDPSERFTIAGGIVLDPHGNASAKCLRERAIKPNDIDLCVRTELSECGAVPADFLLRHSRFSREDVIAARQRLKFPVRNGLAIHPKHWTNILERAGELIDQTHRGSPDKSGLELSELRSNLNLTTELSDAVIDELCASGFARTRSTIARKEHRPSLIPGQRDAADRILRELGDKPFDPPARKQIATDKESQRALHFLLENQYVVELGPDVVLLGESFQQMKNLIAAFISENGPATVSQLRQELKSSRRVIVPFLERLDRDGVTRRIGDKRKLADEIVSGGLK